MHYRRPPYDPAEFLRIIEAAGAPSHVETLAAIGEVCQRLLLATWQQSRITEAPTR